MRFLTNDDVAVTRRLDDHIAVQRHLVLQLHITTLGSAVDLDPVAKINLYYGLWSYVIICADCIIIN